MLAFLSPNVVISSEYVAPYAVYRSYNFDVSNITEVEELTRSKAAQWNLDIVEKNRNQMKIASLGKEAFTIHLMHEGELVLSIGNTGPSIILSMNFYDYSKYPKNNLKAVIQELRSELESGLKLEFCEIDLETSECITK